MNATISARRPAGESERSSLVERLSSPGIVAAGRIVNAAFFAATSVYCILTFSPFAYEQFIQPHVVSWVANFVVLHADFYWLALFVSALTLAPELQSSRVRWMAWVYLSVGAVLGVWLLSHSVLPSGNDAGRSLVVASLAVVPPLWLALFDHLTAGPSRSVSPVDIHRLFVACFATALYVWLMYALVMPLRLAAGGGIPLGLADYAFAAGTSALTHLLAFSIVFVLVAAIGRGAILAGRAFGLLDGHAGIIQYWLFAVAAVGATTVTLQRVVLLPIAVAGPAGWALAAALASMFVALGSGIASRYDAAEPACATRTLRLEFPATQDPFELWFGPLARRGSTARALTVLALLPLGAYVAASALTTFDWGFMFQKLSALAATVAAFGCVYTVVPLVRFKRRLGMFSAVPVLVMVLYFAAPVAATTVSSLSGQHGWTPELALDAYSAGDPSFRLEHQLLSLGSVEGDASFYTYLRANSSITRPIPPVSVDFVAHLTQSASSPARPNIFLFIIDSLRRDYIAPYNREVTFTPQLAEFAADSFVFDRAFSRYGGTGLAVPAIWAGALIPHKQYVTPFAPMNALRKLIESSGYRQLVAQDHITEELYGVDPPVVTLDTNIPEMMHTFCGTAAELERDLGQAAPSRAPVFVLTRPLDLHIGNTRTAKVPPGESYPGFFEPYAARVHHIDTCFGELMTSLKGARLYDNSIIIVIADHGDSLGEGLRWGHGYTVYPEVIRIPLLIHLPRPLRDRFEASRSHVSFSTDVTPTLYALLGYRPEQPRALAGSPLFQPAGVPPLLRDRESFLVASSYGAVYGLLQDDGRSLYIADAIEGHDYRFTLGSGGDRRVGITDSDRSAAHAAIRAQVADLAKWYGFGQ